MRTIADECELESWIVAPGPSGTVLINNTTSGAIIRAESLEERPLDKYEKPSDSYSNLSILAGRVARRDIKANHIVMIDDVNPDIGLEEPDRP